MEIAVTPTMSALFAAACVAVILASGFYLYDRKADQPAAPSSEEKALIDGLTRGFMAVGEEAAAERD